MSTVVTETTETTSTVLECFSMAQKFYTRPANGTLSAYGNEAEARNTGTNPMADTPIVKAFKIRIISGPYVGRYVGMHFGVGMVSNREVLKNAPVNLPGMNYGAWVQEQAATQFLEKNAGPVLAALNQLGCKSELIKVQG